MSEKKPLFLWRKIPESVFCPSRIVRFPVNGGGAVFRYLPSCNTSVSLPAAKLAGAFFYLRSKPRLIDHKNDLFPSFISHWNSLVVTDLDNATHQVSRQSLTPALIRAAPPL